MNPEEKGKKSYHYWKNQSNKQNIIANAYADCQQEYKNIDDKIKCQSAVKEESEKEQK